MEKRIGVVAVLVTGKDSIPALNAVLSDYSEIIFGRQGLPFKNKGIHVISLVVEGDTDQIGAMTGRIGRLKGIQVKSVLTQYKEYREDTNEEEEPGFH